MVLEIVDGKKKKLLYGRKMTETELREQIKFIEGVSGSLKEDFFETMTRIYDWDPVVEWEYVDFVYDCQKKTLEHVEPEKDDDEEKEKQPEDPNKKY